MQGVVISLFDHTGNMARPWAEAGHECWCVDIENDDTEEQAGDGVIHYVQADVREWLPPLNVRIAIVFGFPPCDNLAVSGARWMPEKGLDGLDSGVTLFKRAREFARKANAPWMLENPVSTISSYWRDPDHTFHPFQFDPYTERDERYTKKTMLWTGNGFEMPDPHPDAPSKDEADDRIHKMAPSEQRSAMRSETPMGFARAVFEANTSQNNVAVGPPDTNTSQYNVGVGDVEVENKRDAVWITTIQLLRSGVQQFRRADVSEQLPIEVHPNTVRDVLSSMEATRIIRSESRSPIYRTGPAVSEVVGPPAPTATTTEK